MWLCWWCCFPTWKHEKWQSLISPTKQLRCQVMVRNSSVTKCQQSNYFGVRPQTVVLHVFFQQCMDSAQHFSHSWFNIFVCHTASHAKDNLKFLFERPEHLDWDASEEIWLESHFKPPIQFAKNAFYAIFFCCPDFLKSGYNLGMPKDRSGPKRQ